LGECNKIHSLALRSEYEKASAKRDYEYEEEVRHYYRFVVLLFCCQILQYLQSFIKDNERKIELAKKRLEMQEKNPELEAKVCKLELLVSVYSVKMNYLLYSYCFIRLRLYMS